MNIKNKYFYSNIFTAIEILVRLFHNEGAQRSLATTNKKHFKSIEMQRSKHIHQFTPERPLRRA